MTYYEGQAVLKERLKYKSRLDNMTKNLDSANLNKVADTLPITEKEVKELDELRNRLKGILKRWPDNTKLLRSGF
jgi:hypothetical protein